MVAQWEGVTDKDDIDHIDLLARTGRDEFVNNGSNEDWLALCDFCKKKDLNARSVDAAVKIIAGTARSMGIEVVE